MEGQLFYMRSPLFVLCAVSVGLFAAAAIGFAVGLKSRDRTEDKSEIGTIQASILGMLGLLLGFTFAIASSRYDSRRVLAIDEANALGTTFMRAQTLPEPHRRILSDSLRRYVDLRVRAAPLTKNPAKLTMLRSQTEQLQQTIWRQTTVLARQRDTDITAAFVESLNETINLYATRVATYYARVPNTILWTLLYISVAAVGIVGYGFGLAGQRGWLVMAMLSLIVAAVVVMIVDLDRPEAGPTRISQQTMADLRRNLSGYQDGAHAQGPKE